MTEQIEFKAKLNPYYFFLAIPYCFLLDTMQALKSCVFFFSTNKVPLIELSFVFFFSFVPVYFVGYTFFFRGSLAFKIKENTLYVYRFYKKIFQIDLTYPEKVAFSSNSLQLFLPNERKVSLPLFLEAKHEAIFLKTLKRIRQEPWIWGEWALSSQNQDLKATSLNKRDRILYSVVIIAIFLAVKFLLVFAIKSGNYFRDKFPAFTPNSGVVFILLLAFGLVLIGLKVIQQLKKQAFFRIYQLTNSDFSPKRHASMPLSQNSDPTELIRKMKASDKKALIAFSLPFFFALIELTVKDQLSQLDLTEAQRSYLGPSVYLIHCTVIIAALCFFYLKYMSPRSDQPKDNNS